MWILKNTKGVTYYLTTDKEHVVSRKDGDLILENDQSISRRHAVVSVTYNSQHLANIKEYPVVAVMDTNSKYGTFVSDGTNELKKLTSNVKEILKNGFCVRFGLQWNEWKLEHLPLVITTSTLTPEEKRTVQKDILTLGGHIVNSWIPEVTHVVMSKITLTVKVVCALAYGKPIVTPQYWHSYVEAISSRTEPPDYRGFVPPLAESTLNINEVSFDINENRRRLFSGKHFFFTTQRQFNSYACMVNAAGGSAEILDLNKHPKEYYVNPDCIVLQYATDRRSQESQVPNDFEDLIKLLKEDGRRVIPESEIALAVLYCSLEKHCNPEFSAASSLVPNKSEINATGPNLLAMDTQESMPPSLHFETKIIPDSGVIPTPGTSGKQGSVKNVEESISVWTGNVISRGSEAGSSKQSHITDYIKNKKVDYPVLETPDSGSNNTRQHKIRENIQGVSVMDSETEKVVKTERMTPVSDDSSKWMRNFNAPPSEAVTSKKRPSEENVEIQCVAKKIKSNDNCESEGSSYISKKYGKKLGESSKDSGACVELSSKDFSKMGKAIEMGNKVLKQENHDNDDAQQTVSYQQAPHGIKRKHTPNNDEGQCSKRQTSADITYSNCATLPVEESFSAMSLNGFINTEAVKKKASLTSVSDTLSDTAAEEEDLTLIEFKDLVARKNDNSSVKNTFTEQLNQSITNFKKFRKVRCINRHYIPVELDAQNNMDDTPEILNDEFLNDEPQRAVGGGYDGNDGGVDGNGNVDEEEEWFFNESSWKTNQSRTVT